jgi:undecaprenyl-diphosphatase
MTLGEAAILGLVQGLSEFLPISSSGHLVLFEEWLGIGSADLVFEIAVHAGTLLAIFIYFRKYLWEYTTALFGLRESHMASSVARRELLLIIIGTVPAGVIGVMFKAEFEAMFADPMASAIQIIITGLILLSTLLRKQGHRDVSVLDSLWIGIAQAVSILPGISRSGATIATGLWAGIRPARVAEFSFILSIPAVAGAILLTIPEAWGTGQLGPSHLVGAFVAFVSGYVALRIVFAFLRSGRFALFGVYCLVVGALAAIFLR